MFTGCYLWNGKSSEDGKPSDQPTPTIWFDKGAARAEKGEYDQAITAFNKAVKMDRLYTGAYFYRGQIWEEKGEIDKAISDYTKVLKLNPNLERAYEARGHAWHRKGRFDKAIEDYTKVLEMNPDHPDIYHNRGSAWGKAGNYDQAIADFNKALELSPNEAALYDNRGSAWRKKGDYGRAIRDYVRALDADPDFAITYNNLAWLLATCPEPKYRNGIKALKLAQKALELTPDASTLDTLAAAYAEAGKFKDAVRVMERILSMVDTGDTEYEPIYRKHLESYKANTPWRTK